MKRIAFASMLIAATLCFGFSAMAQRKLVEDVEIRGYRTVPVEEIKKRIKTQPGDEYKQEQAKQVLAPDVRWEVVEGLPYSGVYLGLKGVSDFFTRLFSDFEDWRTEPSNFFETGDRVIAIGEYSAKAKATGKTFKARFANVWTMRNGVIARLQQVADTAQIARALESDARG